MCVSEQKVCVCACEYESECRACTRVGVHVLLPVYVLLASAPVACCGILIINSLTITLASH